MRAPTSYGSRNRGVSSGRLSSFIGGGLGVTFAAIDVLHSCASKKPRDLSLGNLVTICF